MCPSILKLRDFCRFVFSSFCCSRPPGVNGWPQQPPQPSLPVLISPLSSRKRFFFVKVTDFIYYLFPFFVLQQKGVNMCQFTEINPCPPGLITTDACLSLCRTKAAEASAQLHKCSKKKKSRFITASVSPPPLAFYTVPTL